MSGVYNKKYITALLHVMAWLLLGFVLIFYPPMSSGLRLPNVYWIKQCIHIVILIAIYYTNSYLLIPKYLVTGKQFRFIYIIFAVVILCSVSMILIDRALNLSQQMDKVFGGRIWRRGNFDYLIMLTSLLVFGISTSIASINRWQSQVQNRERLEKQHALAELAFLKAQINPHFFFNTLNSIYALTYINVEVSRDALHKLSRMMRYLLYETANNITPLKREIDFINDYIELMKLRLDAQTKVNFHFPVNIVNHPITPMLLLPFVENAFKHGVSNVHPGTIEIQIEQDGNILELHVTNKIVQHKGQDIIDDSLNGIGLANTTRRLELLYKGKYTLAVNEKEHPDYYIIHLKMSLS
ncbi:sensor histidine kinase [Pedobacter sp. AW1-32]|uniref:sensor histidine kinase n=1 Tax=Pedobacter sp. AW1-32 TaxID=3383026 RepID=UPI003FEEC303